MIKLTKSQQRLVEAHLWLVDEVCGRYLSSQMDASDGHSAALEGLCQAALDYIPGPLPFKQYAYQICRRFVWDTTIRPSAVYYPLAVRNSMIALHKWRDRFETEHHRPPTPAEEDEFVRAKPRRAYNLMTLPHGKRHWITTQGADEAFASGIIFGEDDSRFDTYDEQDIVYKYLERHSSKDRELLIGYFGLCGKRPLAQKRLGEDYGASQPKVSRRIKELLLITGEWIMNDEYEMNICTEGDDAVYYYVYEDRDEPDALYAPAVKRGETK